MLVRMMGKARDPCQPTRSARSCVYRAGRKRNSNFPSAPVVPGPQAGGSGAARWNPGISDQLCSMRATVGVDEHGHLRVWRAEGFALPLALEQVQGGGLPGDTLDLQRDAHAIGGGGADVEPEFQEPTGSAAIVEGDCMTLRFVKLRAESSSSRRAHCGAGSWFQSRVTKTQRRG